MPVTKKKEIAGSCEGCWAMSSYFSVPGICKDTLVHHLTALLVTTSYTKAYCQQHVLHSTPWAQPWNNWLPPSTTLKAALLGTYYFSLPLPSPITHFSNVKMSIFLPRETLRFNFQIDYFTIRKYKLSFPIWEIFLLQIAAALTQICCCYTKSKPSGDGDAAPAEFCSCKAANQYCILPQMGLPFISKNNKIWPVYWLNLYLWQLVESSANVNIHWLIQQGSFKDDRLKFNFWLCCLLSLCWTRKGYGKIKKQKKYHK